MHGCEVFYFQNISSNWHLKIMKTLLLLPKNYKIRVRAEKFTKKGKRSIDVSCLMHIIFEKWLSDIRNKIKCITTWMTNNKTDNCIQIRENMHWLNNLNWLFGFSAEVVFFLWWVACTIDSSVYQVYVPLLSFSNRRRNLIHATISFFFLWQHFFNHSYMPDCLYPLPTSYP